MELPREGKREAIRITETDANFIREPLVRPFGFKGNFLTELWQTVVRMQSETGKDAIGLATQSVLYGDADLFAAHSESYGNALMYILAYKALAMAKETTFHNPVDLLDQLLEPALREAVVLTGKKDLNINFVFNSLVSVDNAAWLLYARERGLEDFLQMLPPAYHKALSHQNQQIAVMYQVPYNMPAEDLMNAAAAGYFVFKIKTGMPGDQQEMLEKDMQQLTRIHQVLKGARTSRTANGKVYYTMDANGRYQKKDAIRRYLDHARRIGAFEQILLYEEPFVEENQEDVSDLGVRIAADESVHTEADARRRIEQGYRALVLKGIAKTLSQSLKIARLAHQAGIACLCSDLTVNPLLVDWHKNLAARLAPFPELGMGMMETNGDMNYVNWDRMMNNLPYAGASWIQARQGCFELDASFYARSGGIFEPSSYYQELIDTAKI